MKIICALFVFPFLFSSFAQAQTLSIAVTESTSGEYDDDVNAALAAGASATSLSLYWDEGDSKGNYNHDPDWPSIANSYYPYKNIGLILSIPVIDTIADRRPSDLKHLSFDDPAVIARFESYILQVLTNLRETQIYAISIGNEVDGVLQSQQDWDEFGRFFAAARDIVRQIAPHSTIGFTVTWQGVSGRNAERISRINTHADAFFVNYYPLDNKFRVLPPENISEQLDQMIDFAAGKPVFMIETGYPSQGCRSSDARQLEYFQALFDAWQSRETQIPLIGIDWLHDISGDELRTYRGYYGISGQCFLDYLATLGLRQLDGQNKPAFDWLASR